MPVYSSFPLFPGAGFFLLPLAHFQAEGTQCYSSLTCYFQVNDLIAYVSKQDRTVPSYLQTSLHKLSKDIKSLNVYRLPHNKLNQQSHSTKSKAANAHITRLKHLAPVITETEAALEKKYNTRQSLRMLDIPKGIFCVKMYTVFESREAFDSLSHGAVATSCDTRSCSSKSM